jgi:hypothetical protein
LSAQVFAGGYVGRAVLSVCGPGCAPRRFTQLAKKYKTNPMPFSTHPANQSERTHSGIRLPGPGADLFHRPPQIFQGIGVAEPQISLAESSETRAVQTGDPGLVQQPVRDFF